LLFIAFGILDFVVGGSSLSSLWAIRYGVVSPILLGLFTVTFFPVFFRAAQAALSLAMLATGLGVIAMTAIMGPPFNSLYYAGLIIVASYCGSLIRLKFENSVWISLFLFAAYQAVALWINPIPVQFFVSNDFFLAMATGVGLFSAYIQELYVRKAYVGQKTVEEKNKLITEALAESVRANKSKSEFLATMSHELRTPLNAIIGFSDIIRRELFGPLGNGKYTEYARDINESGSHLLAIINDILDLAKAESGKLELNEQEFDVTETLESCIRMCRGRAEANKVELIFFGGQTEIRALADERLLLQIVANLLTNAIKFTPEGGTVRLYVSASVQKGILIKVTDTGIGIAPENIERVLRPFEQVETSYSSPAQRLAGTAICKAPYRAPWRRTEARERTWQGNDGKRHAPALAPRHYPQARRVEESGVTRPRASHAEILKVAQSAPGASVDCAGALLRLAHEEQPHAVGALRLGPGLRRRQILRPGEHLRVGAVIKRPVGNEFHRPEIAESGVVHVPDDEQAAGGQSLVEAGDQGARAPIRQIIDQPHRVDEILRRQ
jgi:signal transduction histidine kinase